MILSSNRGRDQPKPSREWFSPAICRDYPSACFGLAQICDWLAAWIEEDAGYHKPLQVCRTGNAAQAGPCFAVSYICSMATGFLKEISALIRNSNASQVASRLSLISSDSPKRSFLDVLATRSYQVSHAQTKSRKSKLSFGVQAGLEECERAMSDDWAEVVCHSVFAALRKRNGQLAEACAHQVTPFACLVLHTCWQIAASYALNPTYTMVLLILHFGPQESAVEAFLRVFKSLTRIFIPVLKVLLVDLRRLASQVEPRIGRRAASSQG